MKFTLVFLTLNEIDGLKAIFKNIPLNSVDEVFAVDGGSTDGTLEFYKKHNVKVINQKSKGRGEAFRIAMKEAKGDVVIFFSPDGNEDPADIPKFRKYFEEQKADLVIASRMMKGAVNEEDSESFKWRKWANNTFNFAANLLFRKKGRYVTDSINGYRAIKKSAFEKINPKGNGYTIEYEMTMKAFKNRLNIIEFPTIESPRIGGESYAKSIPTGIKFLQVLFKEILESIKHNKHLLLLALLLIFSFWIRYEGIHWNIKNNSDFQYSIHIDEVYKIMNTLSLDISENGMKTTEWLMIKGAGYPNFAKIIYDISNNDFGRSIFRTIYRHDLNTAPGLYLFFRSITAIFSIILTFVVYKLANQFTSNKYTGVIAAFLFSTIFGSFYSSIIFKSDIVTTTFITITLFGLVKYLKSTKSKYLYFAAVFFGLAVATKYNAIFTVLLFPLTLIIELILKKRLVLKNFIISAFIAVASAFALSPYMFLDFEGLKHGLAAQQFYQTNRSFHFEEWGFQPLAILNHILQSSLGPVLLMLFIASLVYIVIQIIKYKQYIYTLPLILFITYFAVSSTNTWIVVRYTIPFYPVIAIFSAIFIVKITEYFKTRNQKLYNTSLGICSILVVMHFIYFLSFSKLFTTTTTTVQASNWIKEELNEGDRLVHLQQLGSEPFIVYGFDNVNILELTGDDTEEFIEEYKTIDSLQNFDYIMFDERSFRQYYRLKSDKYQKYRDFYDSIMNSENFELVKKFEINPEIAGIKIDEGFLPQDILLAAPDIYIYKKVTKAEE